MSLLDYITLNANWDKNKYEYEYRRQYVHINIRRGRERGPGEWDEEKRGGIWRSRVNRWGRHRVAPAPSPSHRPPPPPLFPLSLQTPSSNPTAIVTTSFRSRVPSLYISKSLARVWLSFTFSILWSCYQSWFGLNTHTGYSFV